MIIGLTGGVGCGKSLFAQYLSELGARVIYADMLARQLMENDLELVKKIKSRFGASAYSHSEKKLNSSKLGEIVFNDREALDDLNSLVWPVLVRAIKERIDLHKKRKEKKILVAEMAVLFEAGAEELFDQIVLITAPLECRIERLCKSRGWEREDVIARIHSQLSDAQKIKKAHIHIENSGSSDLLKKEAAELLISWQGKN